ncbi:MULTISPECIES: MerR family transcriptional regulator [Streptomyces]|uniref:MerR family transcriptional regulator n=1 Tax=Streptomyces virginiae TaxID=1961 RepID=A0ABQ3NZR5_STRVG|nr:MULTISPECIES: MerR family transcriptional regulator [Streptomyces]KOU16762.1 MerR family transcriptional regulator [Streptomyces sp. WM6349]KOU77269.1 MerR family transcriptional regulator [Streptomyces sp. XY593]KOU90667.1 MerR family transcriptional regulator [Streptomyces sp. XY533]KOU98041.1 MerR family transcriptional regulator [Streptomyces sp. XY511]KOV42578.1 MerR family transcriptional regulator [Streptomyces sp. H036]
MRIGEIAAVVGVTTRAIRHYHHVGLLPEPERRPNGYRAYGVRDAVLLARVRRLTELGLSLDEVRDVLADDAGRDLADVLEELDADLARQEAEIKERRRRLAVLLAAGPGEGEPLSPALAALLAKAPRTTSPTAAKDREHLTLLDASGAGGQEIYAALGPLAEDPGVLALYERLDELADAPVDDPRIPGLAAELVAAVPEEVFAAIPRDGVVVTGFKEALLAEYAPAQAEVVRRVMEAFMDRGGR